MLTTFLTGKGLPLSTLPLISYAAGQPNTKICHLHLKVAMMVVVIIADASHRQNPDCTSNNVATAVRKKNPTHTRVFQVSPVDNSGKYVCFILNAPPSQF